MGLKQRRMGMLVGCGAAVAMSAVTAEQSKGGVTLFNSNGFEATSGTTLGYVAGGSLSGQPATAPVSQQWGSESVTGTNGNTPTAAVQTYVGTFGATVTTSTSQLVALNATGNTQIGIDNAASGVFLPLANTPTYGTPYTPNSTDGLVVNVRFSMSVQGGSGEPVFGILAGDGSAAGTPLGELLVDPTANDVTNGVDAVPVPASMPLSPYNFYQYELQLNYQSKRVNLYEAANNSTSFGAPILSASFFDTTATTFGYAALVVASDTPDGVVSTGSAFVDNYSVTTAAVPEPVSGSLVIAAIAALGGGRRRRRRTVGH